MHALYTFYIEGRILVQLPSGNTTDVIREARIRSQVNLTFDCGPHIDYEKSRIPSDQTVIAQRTIWYHVGKDIDGKFLSTNITVTDNTE